MAKRDPLGGLQWLPIRIDSPFAAMSADDVDVLDSSYGAGNLKRTFLCKQVKINLHMRGNDAGDGGIFGLAAGGLTTTEILAALTDSIPNPNDASVYGDIAQKVSIFWETLFDMVDIEHGGHVLNKTVTLGGGKGIPLIVDQGVQAFFHNPSSGNAWAVTTRVQGLITYIGVWLDDA